VAAKRRLQGDPKVREEEERKAKAELLSQEIAATRKIKDPKKRKKALRLRKARIIAESLRKNPIDKQGVLQRLKKAGF
jgi:hypothetical protein